jgi:hypothetical protein
MEEDTRFRSLENIIRDMHAEGVTGTGRMAGSRSTAFRQSSKSNSTGQHNHGIDIGARRNYAHELAAKRKSEAEKKNRENEVHKREVAFVKRKEEMLQHAKTSHKNIYHSEEVDPNAGTSARVKIKNVSRPDDADPTSPKSKLSKTSEIVRKIIEEKPMPVTNNLGSPDDLIKAVRSVLEVKDPRKLHGGKTQVDTKPTLSMQEKLSDKQQKIAAAAGDKDKIDSDDFKALRDKKCSKCGKVNCDCANVKEEVIDERELTPAEMEKREKYVKGMKSKLSDFEKRYPGRGKDIMYATATKMAKEEVELTDEEIETLNQISSQFNDE